MFGGEQQVITIQCINPLLDAVVDRFGKKGILYNVVDDKHFSITAPVEISDQFYGWVLGFGNKMKILKPQKVVEGFTEYLNKIRNMYESCQIYGKVGFYDTYKHFRRTAIIGSGILCRKTSVCDNGCRMLQRTS